MRGVSRGAGGCLGGESLSPMQSGRKARTPPCKLMGNTAELYCIGVYRENTRTAHKAHMPQHNARTAPLEDMWED